MGKCRAADLTYLTYLANSLSASLYFAVGAEAGRSFVPIGEQAIGPIEKAEPHRRDETAEYGHHDQLPQREPTEEGLAIAVG